MEVLACWHGCLLAMLRNTQYAIILHSNGFCEQQPALFLSFLAQVWRSSMKEFQLCVILGLLLFYT